MNADAATAELQIWPPADAKPPGRFLLLAALLHLWLVLMLGNAPGGTAAPGAGVFGSLNITLQGAPSGAKGERPLPPTQATETGAAGDAPTPRAGGAVRDEVPQPEDVPGAAQLGDWAPTLGQPSDLPAATGASLAAPAPAAAPLQPLREPAPMAVAPTLAAVPALADLPPATAAPAPAPVAPPALATRTLSLPDDLRSALAPAAPLANVQPLPLPPPAATLPQTTALAPALRERSPSSLPAPRPSTAPLPPTPVLASPPAGLGDVPAPRLAALPAPMVSSTLGRAPAAVPALPSMPDSPSAPALPGLPALPALQPVPPQPPAPSLARLAPLAPAAGSQAPQPSLPTTANTRAVNDVAAALQQLASPRLGPPLPGPGQGAPDAGSQLGKDVATLPSAPASAPKRLNLDLPRLRGGEISRYATTGLLPALPRPPELPDQLGSAIEKSAKEDCRKAYAGLGPLAVLPLAVDAVREGGCKW